MGWQSLIIQVKGGEVTLLSEVLLALGALSVSVEDSGLNSGKEQALYAEFGKPVNHYWEESTISALFDESQPVPHLLEKIKLSLQWETMPEYSIVPVPEQDWLQSYRDQCRPVKVTSRLWVVPSWQDPPDPNAINVIMDPGLAFGSGTHPTTRLCLKWLEENIKGGETVVDYGCGSGILAIAAGKLGAGKAVGIDIDPQALTATVKNAELNQVKIPAFLPDKTPEKEAGLLVANILANPLKELAEKFAALVRPGGRIALSGILGKQEPDITGVYQEWFGMDVPVYSREWVLVGGTRKS